MTLMVAWAMTGDYYTGGDTDLDAHGGVGDDGEELGGVDDDRRLPYRWNTDPDPDTDPDRDAHGGVSGDRGLP